ncbi:MAG: hypothetical protein ACKVH7_14560 [Alphaproteobacteria bacterium]|jgi:hypothetical protein
MDDNINSGSKPWFRKKKYGFGFSPNTWQGWLITVVVVIIVIAIAFSI